MNVPFSVLKKARAMQETRKFIEAIQARASGRPHDYTLYFSAFENCARAAYRSRCGRAADADVPEPGMVDEVTFIESCWEGMEQGWKVKGTRKKKGKPEYWKAGDRMGKLLFKLASTHFENDKALKQFLFVSLSNHLENMIADLTPGLDALKRQVRRVMKSFCRIEHSCWVLDGADCSDPVSPADLRRAAKTIPYPKYAIRRTKDGGFSRSIRDSVLGKYLRALMENCGGKVRESDLIDHARDLFGLWIRREAGLTDDEEDESGAFIEEISGSDGTEMQDLLIAGEIHDRLSPQQKRLLRERYIDDLKPSQLAKKYRCTEATISNRFKKIHDAIGTYYEESGDVSHDDRLDSVLRIIIGLCRKEGSR